MRPFRELNSHSSYFVFVRFWRDPHPPSNWAKASSFTRFLDHTQRRTTVDRTPLEQWTARRRDLWLITHDTHNRQTTMPPHGGIRTRTHQRAAEDLRLRPRGHWDRHSSYYLDEFRGFKALTGVSFVCSSWVRFLWAIKCTKRTIYPSVLFISRVRLHRRSDNTIFFFSMQLLYPVLQTIYTDQYASLLAKYNKIQMSFKTSPVPVQLLHLHICTVRVGWFPYRIS